MRTTLTAALLLMAPGLVAAAPLDRPVPTEQARPRTPFDVQLELSAELPKGTDLDRALRWLSARGVSCRPMIGGPEEESPLYFGQIPAGREPFQAPRATLSVILFVQDRKLTGLLIPETRTTKQAPRR
jgi:hypothetical protein